MKVKDSVIGGGWLLGALLGGLQFMPPFAQAASAPAMPTPAQAAVDTPTQPEMEFAAPADARARIGANGKEAVHYKLLDGKGVEVQCTVGNNGSPGIVLSPQGAPWDFSAYGAIEAQVTNLSAEPLSLFMRVDNPGDWKTNPWNTDRGRIAAGKSGTVRVTFGYSYGAHGYALDSSKIKQVLIFTNKVKKDTAFRIDAIRATGKPGERPAGFVDIIQPQGGTLIGFDKDFAESLLQLRGTKTTLKGDGKAPVAEITFLDDPKNKMPGTLFPPPAGSVWNLCDYSQVEVSLSNPGTRPVHVFCRVDNTNANNESHSAIADATVAPGAKQTIIVPFAAARPWDGEDKTSNRHFSSDRIVGVLVSTDASGVGQTIDVEGMRASVGAPDVLPDWVGKRPPVPGNWSKTFDDEFTEKTLDLGRWTLPEKVSASIWDSQAVNDAKNALVEDGFLKLKCEKPASLKLDDPKLQGRKYVTCVVTTFDKFAQRYGYFEARMKLPRTMGMWPAFWMMPDRGREAGEWWKRQDTKNGGMEFDIMEHLVRFGPYRYNVAMHWDGYGKEHKATGSEGIYFQPDKDGFVTSGLLWEPGKLTYYCNGKMVGSWRNERISSLPAYIMFTMPVGGWGTGGYVDEAGLPAYFVIDYVRAWQNGEWATPAK